MNIFVYTVPFLLPRKISQQRPSTVVYPDRKATLCDSKLRTLNVDAQCGSDSDLWYYAPWRSPGLTPVNDACGTAGGRVAGQGQGSQVNFSIDAFLSFPNVALFNFFFSAHTTVLLTQSLFSHVFFFWSSPSSYLLLYPELSQGADYTNTSNAVVGDLGSQLPPLETGTTWKLGEHVEVSWATKAWHGGGYD